MESGLLFLEEDNGHDINAYFISSFLFFLKNGLVLQRAIHMFKIKLFILSLTKKIWPKVSFFAILAVMTALAAVYFSDYVPDTVGYKVGAETVSSILNILASSMLAVTTFSLTTMLSAFSSASTNVTPRATQVLLQDKTTQNVLSTFLGSFLFSLVGIICLNAGVYGEKGRIILFISTLLVIVLIVVTLIRWIEHLTKLGRMSETTKAVENMATMAIRNRVDNPYLGANPLEDVSLCAMKEAWPLFCEQYGYIQDIDVSKLSTLAEKHDCRIYVVSLPGTFSAPDVVLAYVEGALPEKEKENLIKAFVIDDQRAFEQDPRFGICVLAEIACRALPPTANDTGTAIDVIGRLVRVLAAFGKRRETETETEYPRIWVPPLEIADLFDDAFNAVSRDANNIFEVHARLQKAFRDLHAIDLPAFRENAVRHSRQAIERADQSSMLPSEKARIKRLATSWYG